MNIFEYTNKGNRSVNQDYVIHSSFSTDTAIFVLADGMGGYSYGEIASHTVASNIVEYVDKNIKAVPPEKLIKDAVIFANDALMIKRLEFGGRRMGTVIAVLLLVHGMAYITWLGDSRVYKFCNGNLIYCTTDHSLVQQLSQNNILTTSLYHKYASVVTRAIMGDEIVEDIPIKKMSAEKGDTFLLCSDGFHDQIDVQEYVKCLNDDESSKLDGFSPNMGDNYSLIKISI